MADERIELELEEVNAGVSEGSLWVALGFRSPARINDTLFIVTAENPDTSDSDRDLLYFERFDQAYSGYDYATRVSATEEAVEIDLTDEGSRELELPARIRFSAANHRVDLSGVVRMLARMREVSGARFIEVDLSS